MNRFAYKRILTTIFAAGLVALGAVSGVWWSHHATTLADKSQAANDKQKPVLYWYDPMVPQQHFDKPGKSPFMDMQLVPKYADDQKMEGVKIDPALTQKLGMRLAPVTRVALSTQIDASGVIGFNERDVAIVQSRAAGYVDRVAPLAPGDLVRTGQTLLDMQVPEWLGAQHELLALKAANDPALLSAARDRLRSLGMTDAMIRAVETADRPLPRLTVVAPIGGVIDSLDVRNGMTLTPGQALVRINGLSTVWLDVAVPAALGAQVQPGGEAIVRIAGISDAIKGKIAAVLPVLNDASRSLRVRVELPNRDGRLRPGLTAQVSLGRSSKASALTVPTEAIIRTGKRALVMVAAEGGQYTPQEITPDYEVGDRTVVANGLDEGQQVVASGQFLIDSEASLNGIMARAPATTSVPASVTLHESDARIVALDDKEIMLAHGPFKTLSMPGMTMPFPLARPEVAQGFAVGDRVRVGVRESDDGLIVERLQKLSAGGQP